MGFLLRVRAALSWLSVVGNAASLVRSRNASSCQIHAMCKLLDMLTIMEDPLPCMQQPR